MIQFHFRTMKAKGNPLLTFDQSIKLDDVWTQRDDVVSGSAVHCQLNAQYGVEMVSVTGKLQATPTMRCARCLCHFKHTMFVDVREMFFEPSEDMQIEEDENIHEVHDDLVVLNPYLAENLLIAIPYVPLCNEQCKGLCSVCGVNQNEQVCQCSSERTNPKFAALAKLLQTKPEN